MAEHNGLPGSEASRVSGPLPSTAGPSADWAYLLTQEQARYLARYTELWASENSHAGVAIFNLSQNPAVRPNHTGRLGELPTLTRNAIWWAPLARRWVLWKELAAIAGYAVRPGLARAARVVEDTAEYSIRQLGNGMHVASVGVVVATVLACLAPAPRGMEA